MPLFWTLSQPVETGHYWITLTSPKENISESVLGVSERSLNRRAKSLPANQIIDELDYPVSQSAISQIEQTGVKIRTISRWLNAVSVEATPQQIQNLRVLSAIKNMEHVALLSRKQPLNEINTQPLLKSSSISALDYGPSTTQLTNIKIVNLHNIGVVGKKILICLLDDGFNYQRTHPALKNVKIEAQYDFIHNIENVDRQPWEDPVQGNHGQGVLSSIGGFAKGNIIGASYGASFLLAKTEMDSSGNVDFHSEEDTYVAALEWAERLGADITSSSLGYKEFTPPLYTTSDLNGRTTKVAQAAVIAARKGVLVVTAMGNEGYISGIGTQSNRADSTLVSPADADSIISVGSTSSDGWLATNSGTGPTADGRIKPEVVAQGMGVYWAYNASSYRSVNGTSCATPLVAGAAALILSAHPNANAMRVREALKDTAQRPNRDSETASYPNNYYGWGFVDAYEAALSLGPVFSNEPTVTAKESQLVVSTFIVSKSGINKDSVFLFYKSSGNTFSRTNLYQTGIANEFKCSIPRPFNLTSIVGYFTMQDDSGRTYHFPPSVNELDTLRIDTLISFNIVPPEKFKFLQNYPNPFSTTTGTNLSFDSPSEDEVELMIYNLLGQRIKNVFRGRALIGTNIKFWNGTDDKGRSLASGVYIARLKTRSTVYSVKTLIIK